jgi:hypothetical protein
MEGIGANNRLSGAVTRLNLKDSLEFTRSARQPDNRHQFA